MNGSSPERSHSLIAEVSTIIVNLGEVAEEKGNKARIRVDQQNATGYHRGICEVSEKTPCAPRVKFIECSRENELNVQHFDIIICSIIIIYFNFMNLIIH